MTNSDFPQETSTAESSTHASENQRSSTVVNLDNPHDVANPDSPLSEKTQRIMRWVFLGVLAISAVLFALGYWRKGGVLLGADFVYLGILRWGVDSRILGVFAVRSRKFDSIFCILLGVLIIYLTLSVDSLGS